MNRRSNVFGAAAFAVAIALGLAGCAHTTPDDASKAGVEDRNIGPTPVIPPPTQPPRGNEITRQPITSTNLPPATGSGGDPALKDPNNILSKRSIFYDYDSDAIKDQYQPLVQAHGQYLSSHNGAKMLIQGNTDDRGSREYNIALGQRRAEAVKRMLVLQGAKESQIEAVSLGKEKPRCTESTEDCYSQNRRSDLLYNGEY